MPPIATPAAPVRQARDPGCAHGHVGHSDASSSAIANHRRWPARASLAAFGALATGAGIVLSRVDPNRADSLLPACPFHALTGFYCPGCGSTRALHALVHGDVMQALTMNPMLVVALPPLALMACSAAGLLSPRWQPVLRVVADARLWLVLLVGYGVLRNLPWFPFTWLAPG